VKIDIPELSLIILLGAAGSGKSTFARKHFLESEILSLGHCHGVILADATDQSVKEDALNLLHSEVEKRLAAGRLSVIDAANVQSAERMPLLKLAKDYHVSVVAIALNIPEAVCYERNAQRLGQSLEPHMVRNQTEELTRSLKYIEQEKNRRIYILNSEEEIESVEIERQPLQNNKKQEHGPFDIIGDIHGCCDELERLLLKLGYQPKDLPQEDFWQFPTYAHPDGRRAIFLGDLVDRGPRVLDTVRLVRNMMQAGSALCVMGNHENKLIRQLSGKKVKLTHGLAQTVAEIESIPAEKRERAQRELHSFFKSLASHYVLDGGKLVVAHAGLREALQGRRSGYVHNFAMYGETTGEKDEFGLPVRCNWAADYSGWAMVVHGHVPVLEARWLNNTLDVDTGCVFGGKLTALRYPEKEIVSEPAMKVYCEPVKPLDYGIPK